MKINFNMSAVLSNDHLNKSENALSTSIEKLSSGFKINRAKDNPSGIAIAKRMHAQLRCLASGSNNASDGVSIINVAEGAMTEVHEMLQRMNELSIQASNGPMSDSDRQNVQEEIDSLLEEIDRIAESTDFNGRKIINGTYDLKGYVEKSTKETNAAFDTLSVKVESYSDEAKIGFYEVVIETGWKVEMKREINEDGEAVDVPYDVPYVIDAKISSPPTPPQTEIHGKMEDLETVQNQKMIPSPDDDHTVTIVADNGFSLTLDIDLEKFTSTQPTDTPNTSTRTVNVDLTGIGPMTTQVGAAEGQELDIRIPKVSCKTLGVAELDVSTEDEARNSIDRIGRAINNLSSIRSRLGAYQNRLEHMISSLDITQENLTGAYARIMDTDMAEEMTEYTKDQVLSQAGTSMLAQANQRPSQILQLLQ